MKLIFLDVDGVLNCKSTLDKCGPYKGIENKKVSLLKEIVNKTKAKIVLVSSWKEYWYKSLTKKPLQDDIANYLDMKLSNQGLTILGKTKDLDPFKRGEGILSYLNKLKTKGINVSDFIIIDDEYFDYKKTFLINHLVKTSYNQDGLTIKLKNKAINMLNGVYELNRKNLKGLVSKECLNMSEVELYSYLKKKEYNS